MTDWRAWLLVDSRRPPPKPLNAAALRAETPSRVRLSSEIAGLPEGQDRWAAGRLTGTTLEQFLLADSEEAPHA